MNMNNTRTYLMAVFVALVGVLLHAYENVFKANHLSLGWFAWAMVPYAVCLAVWMRSRTGVPALVGVVIALMFDLYVHYHVFIHPGSSTAGLVMIFAPLWSALLFCPAAMLISWLMARQRGNIQRHAP